jgi:hypothetical protein
MDLLGNPCFGIAVHSSLAIGFLQGVRTKKLERYQIWFGKIKGEVPTQQGWLPGFHTPPLSPDWIFTHLSLHLTEVSHPSPFP